MPQWHVGQIGENAVEAVPALIQLLQEEQGKIREAPHGQ